jgi:type IV pilus assembly protein PilA
MLARIRKAQEENEGGFTLIELLVVIIIIGILAAIAIPVFLNQRQKGYDAQAKSDLRNMATAEETYLTDNNAYTASVDDLVTAGFKPSSGVSNRTASFVTDQSYTLTACSQSGKKWQYLSSGAGVTQNGTCTYTSGAL